MTARRLFIAIVLMLDIVSSLATLPLSADRALAHGCVHPETTSAQSAATAVTTPVIDPASESPANAVQVLRAQDAAINIAKCTRDDEKGFQQLVTSAFLQRVTGEEDAEAQFGAIAYMTPFWATPIGPVTIDHAGRFGVTVLKRSADNFPTEQSVWRWYLVDEGGVLKLDQWTSTTMPAGEYPDAEIVEVEIVDGAFRLSRDVVPAGPVIFRVRNNSESGNGHGFLLGHLNPDVALEQIVAGERDLFARIYFDSFFGADGQPADFVFDRLSHGTLAMLCVYGDEGSEIYHFQEGMVALLTVE